VTKSQMIWKDTQQQVTTARRMKLRAD